jgi:lipid A 3-O-deacylase
MSLLNKYLPLFFVISLLLSCSEDRQKTDYYIQNFDSIDTLFVLSNSVITSNKSFFNSYISNNETSTIGNIYFTNKKNILLIVIDVNTTPKHITFDNYDCVVVDKFGKTNFTLSNKIIPPKQKHLVKKVSKPKVNTLSQEQFADTTHRDNIKNIKKVKQIISDYEFDNTVKNSELLKSLPIQWVVHRTNTDRYFFVSFENDLITHPNTDRYYTNGITLGMQSPMLGLWKLNSLMIPYRKEADVTYRLHIVQNMYTPSDTRVYPDLTSDRPYSSILYFTYDKINANSQNKSVFSSRFQLGYIGPYSPGAYLQSTIHRIFPTNHPPLGWESQIKSDIIIGYGVGIKKTFVNSNLIDFNAESNAELSTLKTNLNLGLNFTFGRYKADYASSMNNKFYINFFLKPKLYIVGYNALLQGGVINPSNIYTIKYSDIHKLVAYGEFGIHFSYKEILGIEIAQTYISPEFKNGLPHKWGSIRVAIGW